MDYVDERLAELETRIAALERRTAPETTDDMLRDGYFTAVLGDGNLPERILRWTPGLDQLFPTFDQMREAIKVLGRPDVWDFTALADGAHVFGVPMRYS